ncbi:hypothetical protein AQUCO_00400060v1 [Aquilegia coerulea]|uniref:Transposase-associated domain-containing protein n=1 Tax=Aquilegia coerulea TaxID=218851 RepID=A0A2G5ET72_AQUCA|nr:hypothetical protein AQUCO_00400060v1 [Aquilegia coerulea]
MSSTSQSKAWMKEERPRPAYCEGVRSFLKFVFHNSGSVDWHLCPCVKWRNVGVGLTLLKLEEHLICNEPIPNINLSYEDSCVGIKNNQGERPRLFDLVNDALRHIEHEHLDACITDVDFQDDSPTNHEPVQVDSIEDIKAKKLREDATQPLYSSCHIEDSKFSFVVELLGLKSTHNWTDNCFNDLLKLLKRTYPKGNSLLEKMRECLEMIKSLGMECRMIHACPNGCSCLTYKVGRYKPEFLGKNSRVPKQVLRYFPLAPRLRRLYRSGSNSGYMRHPVDSSCWKGIDAEYPEFAAEPRTYVLTKTCFLPNMTTQTRDDVRTTWFS